MSYFFTNNFKTALAANQALMDGQQIKLVLFRYAPALGTISPTWSAARTVADLVATNPGWVEVSGISGYPFSLTVSTSTRTIGGSRYVMYSDYKFAGLALPAEIRAIGVVGVNNIGGIANPLIMVTNTPIGSVTNVAPVDALTSVPDSTFPDNTNRWIFGWSTATPDPVEGKLAFNRGSPSFEVSGSQHCWLYPQRVNMIANPNFEATGMNFWSGNSALTRVAGTAPGSAPSHGWAGKVGAVAVTPSSVRLDGTAGTYILGPDIAALAGAAALTIEIDCSMVDWTPANTPHLLGQFGSAADNSWEFLLGASGLFALNISTAGIGTDQQYASSIVSALTDGTRHVIGGVWTANNGTNSTFQPKRDGTNLGVLRTATSIPAGLRNSTLPVVIGCNNALNNRMDGNIYGVKIWADGKLVASPDFTSMSAGQTSVTDAQGNVWTLSGAATLANPLSSNTFIMESNVFPTKLGEFDNEQWTVQLKAKGTGKLKIGLVYWDVDYRVTAVDWGTETWDLSSGTWVHAAVHRHAPEAHLAMVRLEVQGTGTGLTIDNVLAEPGYLKDWLYFDGDETYGARDDFSWYGGTPRRGASYSLWYNHRRAVTGRLFARTVDPNDPAQNVTDSDMEEQGLVYRWVPAGITVVPHLDVLYPEDVQNPIPAKAAGVLPYYSTGTPDGVSNPWL